MGFSSRNETLRYGVAKHPASLGRAGDPGIPSPQRRLETTALIEGWQLIELARPGWQRSLGRDDAVGDLWGQPCRLTNSLNERDRPAPKAPASYYPILLSDRSNGSARHRN